MQAVTNDMITPSAKTAFWAEAPELLAAVNRATAELSAARQVSQAVRGAVHQLVRVVAPLSPEDFAGADPYLVEALLTGTVACASALWMGKEAEQRRRLRVPLERARQALRDLLDERDVVADQPAKDVARWLVTVTGIPQHELAGIVGVGTRTFQRWVSETEAAGPSGEDEMRLRTFARVVGQLRWSMTPAGVVQWLQRPHPYMDGRRPLELLGEPGAYGDLPRLAGATRAMVAS
ncbi:MAG: hypothetical protein ACRD0Z_01580 [Acidimicrobiales bacterium]